MTAQRRVKCMPSGFWPTNLVGGLLGDMQAGLLIMTRLGNVSLDVYFWTDVSAMYICKCPLNLVLGNVLLEVYFWTCSVRRALDVAGRSHQ